MKAANRQYDLTPKGEFYLIGYGERFKSRREPAGGVHDPIIANVLLLEIQGRQIFVFNADYIEFLDDFCSERKAEMSRRYGLQPELIFFSATHNHQSVRDYHRTWSSGKYRKEYEDFLIETIDMAYQECRAELQEVQARYGRKIITGYYGNRNYPGQMADNEVIIVEFYDGQKVVAGLINWAVHSTVLSPENNMLTAELAGNVREAYAGITGYRPLMIIGAAGDCSTRNYNQGNDFGELERVSRLLAGELAAIEKTHILNVNFKSAEQVEFPVQYSMEQFKGELEHELDLCRQAVEQPELNWSKPISPGFYAKCIQKKLAIEIVDIMLFSTVVDLGDMIIVTIPGELGSKFGIQLKQRCPDKCLLVFGYTDGFLHYMMPKEEYGKNMETIDSLYPPGTIEEYVRTIEQCLK
ncbi:MAG: hypothetical protein ACRDBO_13715 [Lachnospiraceae bacterium]